MQIKKKQELPYSQETRTLSKNYKCLPKFEIRLLMEFCEFDLIKTQKILKVISEYKKPDLVIKEFIEKPQSTDQIIDNLIIQYNNKFGEEQIEEGANELAGKQNQIQINPFFERLTPELIFQIVLFLDPLQLNQFINLKQKFSEYYKQMYVFVQNYFKGMCRHLFTSQPNLPEVSLFEPIKNYILARPLQFSPNVRNMVNSDLRYFIWQSRLSNFRVNRKYYQQFGNFEDIYIKAPRIHFNGFYCLKQKYIHRCEATFDNPLGRFQIVHYYRYVRFFPDGSLLYQVSNKKLQDDQLIKHLSIKNFTQDSECMKGEYIQFKQKLHFKFFRSCVIFNFETNLDSDESIFDVMKVMRFWMQIVDSRFIVQEQYSHKNNEEKFFKYVKFQPFANEMPIDIQRCSL